MPSRSVPVPRGRESFGPFLVALDGLLDPFVLLTPVRSPSGQIVDFRYAYANRAACAYNQVTRDDLVGSSLLALLPEHSRAGLFEQYRRVLETDEPLVLDGISYRDTWGGVTETRQFDVRAYAVEGALAYTWRDVSQRERSILALEESQRIAGVGSWYWDRATDRVRWSKQMYRIFGIDPSASDLTFEEALLAVTHPDDLELPLRARDRAMEDRQPFVVEQRLVRPDGDIRTVVTRGEVVIDTADEVCGMRGTTQDATDNRRAQQRLLQARLQLVEREHALGRERAASRVLQEAIMPGTPTVPGLQVAARYIPASGARVGGDWYDIAPLPATSQVALVVGDVEGHDLAAAALMGQLRSAVRTSLLAGAGPADALTAADRFLRSLPDTRLATAIVVVVDLATGTARLASAGHPPALVAASGVGVRVLPSQPDPPLGVDLSKPAGEHSAALPPNSLLLLYTDGLLTQRDTDVDVAVAGLRGTLLQHPQESPESLIERILANLPQPADDDAAVLVVRLPESEQRPSTPSP